MNRKAQSSFESVLIFGISFTLVLIVAGYFVLFSNSATTNLDESQQDKIFRDVISKASRVYYQGNGNRLTIDATLPDGIESISIHQAINGSGYQFNYLNVTYLIGSFGTSSLLFFPDELEVRMNCTVSCIYTGTTGVFLDEHIVEGPKQIQVQSKGDYVEIDFVRG